MRYLVYGYYGHGNFGDDLLLHGLVAGVTARDGAAEFVVHSRDPVPGLEGNPRVRFVPLARCLEGVRARPWRTFAYLLAFGRWIERTDALIIGGGTLFIDKGRINFSLVLLLVAEWYARLRRRMVVVVGVAIDELTNPITRWATSRILAGARFVAVRDDVSLAYASHLPEGKVRRAADLVFDLPLRTVADNAVRARPVVGLCFIDYFGTVEPSECLRGAYASAILRLIESHEDRYDFRLIVLQRAIGQRDEWLESRLRERDPVFPVHDIDSIAAATRALAAVDVLITTRYHLGVIGLLWKKRVVVIDHELKMRSLGHDFGLPMISMTDFVDRGIPDLDALLQGFDPARVERRLQEERTRVNLNFSWLG